jgi:hypothetical protein
VAGYDGRNVFQSWNRIYYGGQAVKLNESQRKFINDKVSTVWNGKRDCPICIGSTKWTISDIVEVKQFNEGNDCRGAAITPLIQVECNRCSYTLFFNSIGLGVIDRDTGKVKESK